MNETERTTSTAADHDLLIRLDTKFDALSQKLDELSDNIVDRVDALEREAATAKQISKTTNEEVGALKKDVNFLNRYAWVAIGALAVIEFYLMYRQTRG